MLKAKKSLGQNFLINPHIIDKIVAAAEISKDDIILEVGPGTGNLTKKLAEKAKKVIAIEKDHRLIEPLKEALKNYTNIEIVEGDILDPEIVSNVIQGFMIYHKGVYKVVANIPYYITSNFLRAVLEKWPSPKLIVLTIQKEVAQRIIAKPPHMNLLALSAQYYSEPEIIGYISKNNFRPVPRVDSAIIRLKPKIQILTPDQTRLMFKLMQSGFSEKRKVLASLLSKKLKIEKERMLDFLKKEGIEKKSRAENLSLEQWQELTNYLFDSRV